MKMKTEHQFKTSVLWTGNIGQGTIKNMYSSSYIITSKNKQAITCSVDTIFGGDKTKYNPEDFLVASLSSCHMLWYLSLCSELGIVVTHYKDNAVGTMRINANGSGCFTEIVLNPIVIVKDKSMVANANELHLKANKMCFIANSCNFPVKCNTDCVAEIDAIEFLASNYKSESDHGYKI